MCQTKCKPAVKILPADLRYVETKKRTAHLWFKYRIPIKVENWQMKT